MSPISGFGMTLGFDPTMMAPSMGMSLFGNPNMVNHYPPFTGALMNFGNSFSNYGMPRFGPLLHPKKRFLPGIPFIHSDGKRRNLFVRSMIKT